MNYLAHLYFSDPEPLAWAGSLMGDFVKGAVSDDYPAPLRRHLILHRRIDALTLDSPAFRTSCNRLAPKYRHARSVLVDVFYDHFLAQQWPLFHPQPLESFAAAVYSGLAEHSHQLAPGLLEILPRMTRLDWLTSYRDEDVVERVLLRLEERLRYRLPLGEGIEELRCLRKELEDDFSEFMREAEGFVSAWKRYN